MNGKLPFAFAKMRNGENRIDTASGVFRGMIWMLTHPSSAVFYGISTNCKLKV
jgi:hypothetical protein